MKSQKGITLISLTIYITAMTVVIAVMAIISSYFYTNVDETSKNIEPLTEYTKFNNFFTDEVNHMNIKVIDCKESYVVFSNNIQYSYIPENKGIYRNNVKICRNVESCTFSRKNQNQKDIIVVTMILSDNEPRTMEYTLKN